MISDLGEGRSKVASYELVSEVSAGSYGRVYTGKHTVFTTRPTVAIKLLHPHLVSEQSRAAFLSEANILEKLKHPHILPVIDAGTDNETLYIVSEFAAGGSLRSRIEQRDSHPLSISEVINVLSQIGEALHYSHQNNVIHRDLKPENILFSANNEVLLADFGLATVVNTLEPV